jgi:hypothetical protein
MDQYQEFDEKTLRMMWAYCGDPFTAREKTVEMLALYSGEWPLQEFRCLIDAATDNIPLEYRCAARVELEGGDNSALRIQYSCMENSEEIAERVKDALRHARNLQANERKQFEFLKKKFAE